MKQRGWRQGKFPLRRRKDQTWELKGSVWQPVVKEEHVLKEIVARLWYAARIRLYRVRERIPGIGAPSTPGIPDLIGYIQTACLLPKDTGGQAKPLFIECKRPGGVHRVAQEEFIAAARSVGCLAFFAESWDDVRKEFSSHGIDLPN